MFGITGQALLLGAVILFMIKTHSKQNRIEQTQSRIIFMIDVLQKEMPKDHEWGFNITRPIRPFIRTGDLKKTKPTYSDTSTEVVHKIS